MPSASSRPTASFGPAADLAHEFYEQAPKLEGPSLPPVARRVPRSRGRAIAAKVLFVTLFAAVATLLGFALKKKLDASGRASDVSGFFASVR